MQYILKLFLWQNKNQQISHFCTNQATIDILSKQCCEDSVPHDTDVYIRFLLEVLDMFVLCVQIVWL